MGQLIGVIAYWFLSGAAQVPTDYFLLLPIYGFFLSAVIFLSHSERAIAREKLLAARAFASGIAHEMRTPLLGIRYDAGKSGDHLATLSGVNKWARERGCEESLSDEDMDRINAPCSASTDTPPPRTSSSICSLPASRRRAIPRTG